MDYFLDLIVDVEEVDKREAWDGLQEDPWEIGGNIKSSRAVTDASSVITKMVRELIANVVIIYNLIFYGLPHMLCIEKWSNGNRLLFSVILYA